MKPETKEIYSEVYQVLNLLGNEYIEKLPKTLLNMLEEKRNMDYEPKYRDDIPLNEQNIKKETLSIIALLYLNYWCIDESEQRELSQLLKNNEETYQKELREKYNPDNIFKKNIQENVNKEEMSLVKYKESRFTKIINRIKRLFHIN